MKIEIGDCYKVKKGIYCYLQDGMIIRDDLDNIYKVTEMSDNGEIIYFEWSDGDNLSYEDGYGEVSPQLFKAMFEECENG